MSRVELETQGPQPYVLPLHYIQHFEMVPVLQLSTLLPLQRSGLLHRCQRTELTIQPRSITRVSRHQEIERFYGISAKPSSDRKQELYECSLGRFEIGACIAVIYAATSPTKWPTSLLSENRTYYSAEVNYSSIKALRLVDQAGFEPTLYAI